jgi:cytochrome c oxidase subunit I
MIFTMSVLGLEGMNRRIATYLPDLISLNVFTSINGFLFGVGFFVLPLNVLISAYRGQPAPADA